MASSIVLARVTAAAAPLTTMVSAVPTAAWDRPSPCEGWTARDVVAHLIDTQQDFLVDRGVLERPVAQVGGMDRRWDDHVRRLLDVLRRPDAAGVAFDGFFGPATVGDTLVRFYVPDMIVHRWDLALAVGADPHLSEAEMTDLEEAVASWGDALYLEGICRPGVTAPPGADRQTVLLARMGRRSW